MIIAILLLCAGVVFENTRAHEERRSQYAAEIESFTEHNYCDLFQASRRPLVPKNRLLYVHSMENNVHPVSRLCKKLITSYSNLKDPNPMEGPTYVVTSAAIKCGDDVTPATIVGVCKVTFMAKAEWIYLVDGHELNSFYLGMWYRGTVDLIGVLVEKMHIPPDSSLISSNNTKIGAPSDPKRSSEGTSEQKKNGESSAESSLNAASRTGFGNIRESIIKNVNQTKRPADGSVESPLNSSSTRNDAKIKSTALKKPSESIVTSRNDIAKRNVGQGKKPAHGPGESSSTCTNEPAIKSSLNAGQKRVQFIDDSAESSSPSNQRNESSPQKSASSAAHKSASPTAQKSTSPTAQKSTSPTEAKKSLLQLYEYTGQVGIKIFKRPDAVVHDIFYKRELRPLASTITITVPNEEPLLRTPRRGLHSSVDSLLNVPARVPGRVPASNENRNTRPTRGRHVSSPRGTRAS